MNMQLNKIIIGVLFPAIPLMVIHFGDRYSFDRVDPQFA